MDASEKGDLLNKSMATKVTPYGSRYDGAVFLKGHVRTPPQKKGDSEAGTRYFGSFFFGTRKIERPHQS